MATVFMCQDLAQIVDQYGQTKADVLQGALNAQFFGRVASPKTAQVLSDVFGKHDVEYEISSKGTSFGLLVNLGRNRNKTQSIQERQRVKPQEFINLPLGTFLGIAAESNVNEFHHLFSKIDRPALVPVTKMVVLLIVKLFIGE